MIESILTIGCAIFVIWMVLMPILPDPYTKYL